MRNKTKLKIGVAIFLFLAAGFVFYQFSSPSSQQETEEENQASISEGVQVGKLAPDFISEDVNGNKISLSDFQGKKPVLLVFWATWCNQCAKELPDLMAFTQEHRDEIQVIAVASGEPRETLRNYIQEKNINFLMLLDEDRKIWNQYFVRGTPSHFLIDSSGKIVSLRPGLASRENLEIMMTMLTEF